MKNWTFAVLVFVVILFAFRAWFYFLPLSTGDWDYKFPQQILTYNFYPSAWKFDINNGFGTNGLFILPLDTYFQATTLFLFKYLHLPWVLVEKIVWYFPFIIVSTSGAFILFRKFLLKDNSFAALSSLIFTINTYILMITGGGQLGIGMSYAMIPWVFYGFLNMLYRLSEGKSTLRAAILGGLLFSFQIILDLRIAYAAMFFLGLFYLLFIATSHFRLLKKSVLPLLSFFLTTFLLNFFWIIPFILAGQNPLSELGSQYSTSGIISFLSFAKFENTLSLLHPNWPENIFGKVAFLRPEFLIVPILAFSSLLFVGNEERKRRIVILSFALLAIISIFLAKGTNEPFGFVYSLFFERIPGFVMFRDPTKWYGIVALSYSLLLPYALFKISGILFSRFKTILMFVFVVFWVFTIRQAFLGQLEGTFAPKPEPKSYVDLADYLSSKTEFSRTLWIPSYHQYSYFSNQHPRIAANDYFSAYSLNKIGKKISRNLDSLSKAGIGYIIVPEDTQGKIFTEDRKYDDKKYQQTVNLLKKNPELKQLAEFGKIMVFSGVKNKDLFWSKNENVTVSYNRKSASRYSVSVEGAKKGNQIIFSENYDKRWQASNSNFKSQSLGFNIYFTSGKLANKLNSFILPEDGSYKFEVYYKPQDWLNMGLIISGTSLIGILIILFRVKELKS